MNPILVVDDNEHILEILAQYIRAEGCRCCARAAARRRFRCLTRHRPR